MKKNAIDPHEVEEGDIVQYEEKYHLACIVEILNKNIRDDGFIEFKAKPLDVIFGDPSDPFEFGRTTDESLHHYVDWKIKEAGSMTEYVTTDYQEHVQKMKLIEKKYD